ncbi:MAG: transcription antitermination factor NusB, partial [Planctomycetota bacterium]
MATPRDIRRLAFQAIFQLDASEQSDPSIAPMDAEDPAGIRAWLAAYADENASKLRPAEIEKALSLAQDAFADRRAADDAIRRHAPTWPAVRQPAVDRAILRLAHYEITQLNLDPRIAINEAV